MNKRAEAIESGNLKYSTGKPCRRNHMADRYSSNGMCVECVRVNAEARHDVVRQATIKRNQALFSNLREHTYMVRASDHELVTKFTEILQFSPPTVIATIRQYIETVHDACPTPRVLTRADLLKFMDYREDGQVHNVAELELSQPNPGEPILYVYRNGHKYEAEECMEVLRGQRLNVRPKK